MTDRTQFEAMLEALINEDHESAKDIFHNIVVSKSREIYENLLAEEFEEEEGVDEAFGEEEGESDNPFGDEEGEEEEEGESDNPFGDEGDEEGESDNPFGDEGDEEGEGDDPFGDEEGEGGDTEARLDDLETKLQDLEAEFAQLLSGEENEPEHSDMFGGDDDMGGNDIEEPVDEFSQMFEYVNKVALPKHGDNGVNNKSIFNKPKYNDMGGTALKFGKTASGEGTKGGLLDPSPKDLNSGNINVPGGKAGKTGFKKQVPNAHGAEKKGKSETAPDTKSLIGGR